MTTPVDIDAVLRAAEGARPGPYRFAHMLDGMDARMLIDGTGYHFGRSDDIGNGEFLAIAATHAVAMAEEIRGLRESVRLAHATQQGETIKALRDRVALLERVREAADNLLNGAYYASVEHAARQAADRRNDLIEALAALKEPK